MVAFGKVPFLRPALAVVLGIIASYALVTEVCAPIWWLLPVVVISATGSYWLGGSLKRSRDILSGLLLLIGVFLLGFLLAYYAQLPYYSRFFFQKNEQKKHSFLKLKLDDEISARANSWRCKAMVLERIDSSGNAQQVSGNIFVYWSFLRNKIKPNLNYGDEILVADNSIEMPSAAFPDDFDFKAIMRYKNVQHQIFLDSGMWRFSGNSASPLFRFAYYCRDVLTARLHEMLPGKEGALLASLMIGYRDEVDKKDIAAFTASGTTHVLAVSGLHAGLLYLVLIFLLTGKRHVHKSGVFKGTIIILALWLFALLTGLSASVIRAAIMFTIVEIGRSFIAKKSNLINSLFAAAFIQLLLDPLSLMDVGFQLSYLAVLGIATIQPFLQSLWAPHHKYAFYLYQSALLSISATLATLPITLYYFKSFPVWFIPANLLIVPLSTLVIVLGLIAMVVYGIPILGVWAAKICGYSAMFLVQSAHFFAGLPLARITAISFSGLEAILLAGMLLMAFGYLIYKKREMLFAYGALCLCMCAAFLVNRYRSFNKQEVLVSELKGELVVSKKHGDTLFVYSRAMSGGKADSILQQMQGYMLKHTIKGAVWDVAGKSPVVLRQDGNGLLPAGKSKGMVVVWNPYSTNMLAAGNVIVVRKRDVYRLNMQEMAVVTLRNQTKRWNPERGELVD